ncbi:MAG TPA: mechanosensitive ion channel protein MscS [Ignavibacteriales bacterium]|nr:mechanosensitive ion channel protein MscS [Ignavibacteriales bacterium]
MISEIHFIEELWQTINKPIFSLGNFNFSIWTLLYLLLLLFLLFFITSKLKKWFVYKVFAKSNVELGVRIAVATIIRYLIVLIGLFVILQTLGIDLSSVTILAGALGIGIGFGLQNVTNNFVSGLIILFERPIKVGDRIEVGNINGDVKKISLRATQIITNDNISVIVPNSEFISSTVINWSHSDRNIRFNIPVSVSYNEDPEKIRNVLLEVVDANTGILKNPKPEVLFDEYSDSSINFNLRVWTNEYINKPALLKSQLYYEIFKRFRKEGIEIPFPQRDLHIKNTEFTIKKSD